MCLLYTMAGGAHYNQPTGPWQVETMVGRGGGGGGGGGSAVQCTQ